jgi:hypothetical protein
MERVDERGAELLRISELEGQYLREVVSGYDWSFAECGGSVTSESEKQAEPQKQGP